MLTTPAMTGDFHADIQLMLPRLRAYAGSLTRDGDRAEDLVQQAVMKSLVGRGTFRPGTDFAAWLIRIARNEFISGLRRERPTTSYDEADASALSRQPMQEVGLMMRDFKKAFGSLAKVQREALLCVALEGHSYKQIAGRTAVSIGTVKSRIWRARAVLEALVGDVTVGDRDTTRCAPPVHVSRHAAVVSRRERPATARASIADPMSIVLPVSTERIPCPS
jgi:RNA polymerase sigma-70 factor, ECF subfamily